MKKRVVAVISTLGALLCASVAAAVGGAAGDPVLSKSYVDGTYLPQAVAKAETRMEESHSALYERAATELQALQAGYLAQVGGGTGMAGEGIYHDVFSDIRLKEGDTVEVSAGSGFLLLAGSAELSCTGNKAIDLSNGWEQGTGVLNAGRRYLVPERTTAMITVTSPTAVLSLEGYYALTEGNGTDYNALAEALRTLGLFQGSDTGYGSGYDLEKAPTRIQGLIMFLRLIGEEEAALASAAPCPFSDVPAWCRPYVSYAYEKGYTKGMDEAAAKFGTNDTLTAGQYVTFLLRALGYRDTGESPDFTWDTVLLRAQELGLLTAGEYRMLTEQPFLRAQVVYLSYFALDATEQGGSEPLVDRLASNGVIDSAVASVVRSAVDVARIT